MRKSQYNILLTNNDIGPRLVNTLRGQEAVKPGDTLETVMTGAQIDSLDDEYVDGTTDAPRWTIDGATGDDDDDDDGSALARLPVAKLRQIAEAEGVALTNRGKAEDGVTDLPDLKKAAHIAAAIEAHRMTNPAGNE